MLWSQAFAGLVTTPPSIREEEDLVYDLCAAIDGLDDVAEIERALIDVAGWVTRGGVAWWAETRKEGESPGDIGADAAAGITSQWEFPMRWAERKYLIVAPRANCSPSAYRRLRTLVVVADAAAGRLQVQESGRCSWGDDESVRPSAGSLIPGLGAKLEGDESGSLTVPAVQDATFVKAVLPFATRQAKRHREPLCLIYLAIDRLPGIREMLGGWAVEQAVTRVGKEAVSLLRTSDVVARLEDDHILAILPRACLANGLAVADRICRTVEKTPGLFPELGGLTVSAGVAEYPSNADSVLGLIEAADAALEQAQDQGRNRAVAATTAPCAEALAG